MGVTLIHGTFAPHAQWTSPEGAFARLLPEALERPVTMLPPFPWTGENSHEARSAAAHELAAALAATNTPQFLIAHSHGGNVALQALSEPLARGCVRGLVCLNTPFIHVRRRGLTILTLLLLVLHPFALCAWLMLGLFAFHFRAVYPTGMLRPLFWAVVWAAAALPVAFLLRRPFETALGTGVAAIERTQERRSEHFLTSTVPLAPVLPLTVARDEAYWLLRGVDLLSTLLKLPVYAAVVCFVVAYFASEFVNVFWLAGLLYSPASAWGRVLTSASIAGMMISVVMYFVSLAAMVFLMPVLRGHILSYGEQARDSALLDIRVKPFPPGSDASVVRSVRGGRGLRHSSLYSEPEVIQMVAAWMNEQLTAPGSPSGATRMPPSGP